MSEKGILRRVGLSLAALGLAGASVALSPDAAAAQKIDVTTENGITVIRNPRVPVPQPGGPSKLILNEDLVLGRDPAGGADLFAELRSVGVDGLENIWTLDWEDIKVRVFDKAGKLISTFGKKGQGPAEWQNPSRMFVTPDGTGVILDTNKLTFYSLDGRCLKELSTAQARMFRCRVDSRGTIYSDALEFGTKPVMKLYKRDADLNPLATLAEVEYPFKPGAINPVVTLLLAHVTADDRLVWMHTAKYEFHVLNAEGKRLREIVKDYTPVRLTEEDRKRILADLPAQVKSEAVLPDVFPPVSSFIGDPEGRLYAQTYETEGDDRLIYDVFDPEGRCFTRFSLPRAEMAFGVRNGKLYTLIREDEEGVPLVKRYAMEWK